MLLWLCFQWTTRSCAYLKDRLLRADAQDVSVIRQSLKGHKQTLVGECWRVLEKPTLDDRGKGL